MNCFILIVKSQHNNISSFLLQGEDGCDSEDGRLKKGRKSIPRKIALDDGSGGTYPMGMESQGIAFVQAIICTLF